MPRKVHETVMQQVRPLVEQGLSGAEIARRLGLKDREARWYRAHVLKEAAAPNGLRLDASPPVKREDVPLEAIHLEGDTKARVAIDGHLVNEYAEAMTEGAQFPPVLLFHDDEGYWIGDGHHRCRAAKQVGFLTIRAEVQAGGEREAFLAACAANATHGLRRSAIDKRYVVDILLRDEEWSQWSDREIARRCAVSHPERAERLARRSGNGYQMAETRTVQRGETVYAMDTSRIGARAETTAPANEEPRDDRDTHPAPVSELGQSHAESNGPEVPQAASGPSTPTATRRPRKLTWDICHQRLVENLVRTWSLDVAHGYLRELQQLIENLQSVAARVETVIREQEEG
jgi:ParB-like nuclease domain